MEGALIRLGAEHEPPPAWQTRVLAAVRRPLCHSIHIISALCILLAVAVVLACVCTPPQQRPTLDTPPMVRVGRVAHIHATGGPRRALWVCRDGWLEAACPGSPTCTASGVDVTIQDPGDYLVVAVSSTRAIPASSGSCEADRSAAEQAGALTTSREWVVR